jgi:TPR repeat protein
MKQDVIDFFTNELGLEPDDIGPLYESFVGSFGEVARDLRNASPTDETELRRITHAIIGFSQNVGALDLFEAAKTLNAAAKAGDASACHAGMARILALYDDYAK